MRHLRLPALTAAVVLAAAGAVAAKPLTYTLAAETAMLRPGPGVETAQRVCLACHSPDYIAIQPPKKGAAFWEAEVVKMRVVYKAQIDDADAKAIAAYLTATY